MTTDTITRAIPNVTLADVEKVAANDPPWLREARLAAWRAYESMDLPDPGDEEWRRTDIRALAFDRLGAFPAVTRVGVPTDDRIISLPLQTAIAQHPDLVRPELYSVVKPDEWKFMALNAATWDGGAFFFVPKNVEAKVPLTLLTTGPSGEDVAMASRVVVIVGENSRVTLIDESISPDGQRAFFTGAVEIVLRDGANVEYYDINRWGNDVYNFKTVRAILGRDAQFTGMSAGIGSKLTKMRIDAEMPNSGARTQLLGVTFGDKDQHFDYNTLQNHTGDHTISDLQFKSALTDSASLVWYGITRINETAGGSEANQTSRNLLLSENAKAAPIPILEIKAHDVSKCSHGATVGPVDENELFYLEARGISRRDAEHMLVEGYFADILDRVPDASVRARVMDAAMAKIGGRAAALTIEELLSA